MQSLCLPTLANAFQQLEIRLGDEHLLRDVLNVA